MSTRPKVSLRADAGLQSRMFITVLLLGAVYVVLIAALVATLRPAAAIAIVAVLLVTQLFTSDKIALRVMGVRMVEPREAPELHAMIERLCIQADIPKPKIGVMPSSMPNAFAMGRSRKAATVVATTGLLELLPPAELEGVMAHELAHIQHRDVMIMTIASFFASIASLILQFGFFFGGGSDDEESPGILPLILVSLVVYVVSFVLMQALSRYREFAADRGAAQLTGRPSALASALMRISGTMNRLPQSDLRAHTEMNAFYIIPAHAKASLLGLFTTHPPLEKRLAQLQRLEAQMQQGALVR
jgi:heat shock protein HtpX